MFSTIEKIKYKYSNKTIYITGHQYPDIDSYISSYLICNLFNYFNITCEPIILIPYEDIDPITKNIIKEYKLPIFRKIIPKYDDVFFLVDHNNISESIQIIPESIVGIIDHHKKLSNDGIFNLVVESGSTTSLIYYIYEDLGLNMNDEIKKLILLGLLYDTCGLTSSKAKDKDKVFANKISNELGLNLAIESLKAICYTDLSLSVKKLLKNGFKETTYKGIQLASSYLEVKEINDISSDLMSSIEYYIRKYNYDIYLLTIYCFKTKNTITKIFSTILNKHNLLEYNYIASRGSTILPDIYNLIDIEIDK